MRYKRLVVTIISVAIVVVGSAVLRGQGDGNTGCSAAIPVGEQTVFARSHVTGAINDSN